MVLFRGAASPTRSWFQRGAGDPGIQVLTEGGQCACRELRERPRAVAALLSNIATTSCDSQPSCRRRSDPGRAGERRQLLNCCRCSASRSRARRSPRSPRSAASRWRPCDPDEPARELLDLSLEALSAACSLTLLPSCPTLPPSLRTRRRDPATRRRRRRLSGVVDCAVAIPPTPAQQPRPRNGTPSLIRPPLKIKMAENGLRFTQLVGR